AVLTAEDDAVAEHPALLVHERRVARLADLQPGHVPREAVVSGLERPLAREEPLAQRRLVPDADRLAHRVVLRYGIAEVRDPGPALPLREGAAHAALDRVERGAQQTVREDAGRGRHLHLEPDGGCGVKR